MAHMLATLHGVKAEDIKMMLRRDAPQHAEEGFYLEHLWQNANDAEEILFLFRVDDLAHAEEFISKVHAQALADDPAAHLPHMIYLEEH